MTNEELQQAINELQSRLAKHEAENQRLREALEWLDIQAIEDGDWVRIPTIEFKQALEEEG